MGEKALTAAIQESYVQGISTRSVDELVRAMGIDAEVARNLGRKRQAMAGKTTLERSSTIRPRACLPSSPSGQHLARRAGVVPRWRWP
jgi:hypothetical protein